MEINKIQEQLNNYNWDDGFDYPLQLLMDKHCDLAIALQIFYDADGYNFLIDGEGSEMWEEFITRLYTSINTGRYPSGDLHYSIPLNKVQKYKLQKKGIPAIFITNI